VLELRPEYRLDDLLGAANLARSTFYYQMKALRVCDRDASLKTKIRAMCVAHKGRYGYRRITAAIRRDGDPVNHKAVQRVMRDLGLKSTVRQKKYRSYKGEVGPIAPNLLQRDFEASSPNQKWVTDVTEFSVAGKKVYLSPVMDLYNGEIIAHETSNRPDFALVMNMMKKALKKRQSGEETLLHSDQGWHYRMKPYREVLRQSNLVQSMSRKGNCLDNAAMESFFATLKCEYFYPNEFEDTNQLTSGITRYIEYYNHQRIKLKLGGMSPVEYRTRRPHV